MGRFQRVVALLLEVVDMNKKKRVKFEGEIKRAEQHQVLLRSYAISTESTAPLQQLQGCAEVSALRQGLVSAAYNLPEILIVEPCNGDAPTTEAP